MMDCPLWDNGTFDGADGQMSQLLIPEGDTVPTLDMRLADDFYLEPGYMHRLNGVAATFFSATPIPNARLEIRDDCNGMPGNVILTSDAATITQGAATPRGNQYLISFSTLDIWVRGGVYWVSVMGVGEPVGGPEYFWGTTAQQKGSVPKFKSTTNGFPNWTPIDSLSGAPIATRCRDYNFRVIGRSCKILQDNGTWSVDRAGPWGAPSMVNSAFTASNVRTADQFVTNPCRDEQLCYVEAYLFTNCPNAQIEIYDQSCQSPGALVATIAPNLITDVGDVAINGKNLNVLRIEAWQGFAPLTLTRNKTYWISAMGLGDNSLNGSVAYFARNARCDRPDCLVSFTPGQIKGPGVSRVNWSPVKQITGIDMDFAFTLAVRDDGPIPGNADGQAAVACGLADMDVSGQVSVNDLFVFLGEFFTGCP